jgi:hypothetical protein
LLKSICEKAAVSFRGSVNDPIRTLAKGIGRATPAQVVKGKVQDPIREEALLKTPPTLRQMTPKLFVLCRLCGGDIVVWETSQVAHLHIFSSMHLVLFRIPEGVCGRPSLVVSVAGHGKLIRIRYASQKTLAAVRCSICSYSDEAVGIYMGHLGTLHGPVFLRILQDTERVNPYIMDIQRPANYKSILERLW